MHRAAAIALVTGLAWIGTAHASEMRDPAPAAPFLGTCGAETGGFRLPGTDGCLRLGGSVAAEGGWAVASPSVTFANRANGVTRAPAMTGSDLSRSALGVETRLSADLRLPTDAGPMRAYVSLRTRNGSFTGRAAR